MGNRVEQRPSPTSHTSPSSPSPDTAPRAAPRWAVHFSTGFGAGYLPIMPGTYGSTEGVLLYTALATLLRDIPNGVWLLTGAVLLLAVLSNWIIALALPHFFSDDPQAIVLDEIAGQALTLLPLALLGGDPLTDWLAVGTGFILFRAFDALKPWPIWKLGHFKGALGVLADDLGAAVAAALALLALLTLGWL